MSRVFQRNKFPPTTHTGVSKVTMNDIHLISFEWPWSRSMVCNECAQNRMSSVFQRNKFPPATDTGVSKVTMNDIHLISFEWPWSRSLVCNECAQNQMSRVFQTNKFPPATHTGVPKVTFISFSLNDLEVGVWCAMSAHKITCPVYFKHTNSHQQHTLAFLKSHSFHFLWMILKSESGVHWVRAKSHVPCISNKQIHSSNRHWCS